MIGFVQEDNNKLFKRVVEHGLEVMQQQGTQGFDYIVGRFDGNIVRVSLEPESYSSCETSQIDCAAVDAEDLEDFYLAYTLVYDKNAER